jgi:hypothetical protein
MLFRHNDADREYASDDQEALSAAGSADWTIVRIRDDFGEVFGS